MEIHQTAFGILKGSGIIRYRPLDTVLDSSRCRDQQIDLFADTASEEKDDRLSKALDAINSRYGRGTIFQLSEGIAKPWQMKREMLTPNYTTGWSQIPVVK